MPQLEFEFVRKRTPKHRPLRLEPNQEKALISRMSEAITQVQKGGQRRHEKRTSFESENHG